MAVDRGNRLGIRIICTAVGLFVLFLGWQGYADEGLTGSTWSTLAIAVLILATGWLRYGADR